jgi:broad specificity phosphatase PhoE
MHCAVAPSTKLEAESNMARSGTQRILRYLTHPQVRIDPAVPVPMWGLSDVGRARVESFKRSSTLQQTGLVISSAETKALETAAIIAGEWRIPIHVSEKSHENDRSSTGFLPPPEFEKMADAFFANPHESSCGWERAIDAQQRIVTVANEFTTKNDSSDILMVGHGGVGTLLYCHFAGLPIKRISDQPAGGGNIWAMNLTESTIKHGWQAMEALP